MTDHGSAIRVFSNEERFMLDIASQGMLLRLEQTGIISPSLREMVLDNIDHYIDEEITPPVLRSIILETLEESKLPHAKLLRARVLWFFDNESAVRH